MRPYDPEPHKSFGDSDDEVVSLGIVGLLAAVIVLVACGVVIGISIVCLAS